MMRDIQMGVDDEMEKTQSKILMIMILFEYVEFIAETKGKDYGEKLKEQLERDSELSTEDWNKKYKPLWLKMKSDKEFDKYLEEKPNVVCECGSADVSYIGDGEFDKEFEIPMYKWHCHTCDEDFEISIKEESS